MAEPPRLLRVLSAAAEERERAVASRVVSETEALSQMKTGAEIALVRDEIEALKSLQCGAAAGGRGGQKLERTSSVQGLLAQCRAHLRAGREHAWTFQSTKLSICGSILSYVACQFSSR